MIQPVATPDELKRLVERARDADRDAWEALYRHAYPRLHGYARRRLAGDDQADDAVSETKARAIERIGCFAWTEAGFDGWLFGILRNVVLETYRKGTRHPVTNMSHTDEPATDVSDDPATRLVADEEADRLRAAFARLADDDRELLELRVIARLDAEAVGEVVGRRPGAVRMAQSRALGRLRVLLEAQ